MSPHLFKIRRKRNNLRFNNSSISCQITDTHLPKKTVILWYPLISQKEEWRSTPTNQPVGLDLEKRIISITTFMGISCWTLKTDYIIMMKGTNIYTTIMRIFEKVRRHPLWRQTNISSIKATWIILLIRNPMWLSLISSGCKTSTVTSSITRMNGEKGDFLASIWMNAWAMDQLLEAVQITWALKISIIKHGSVRTSKLLCWRSPFPCSASFLMEIYTERKDENPKLYYFRMTPKARWEFQSVTSKQILGKPLTHHLTHIYALDLK